MIISAASTWRVTQRRDRGRSETTLLAISRLVVMRRPGCQPASATSLE